MNERFTFNDSQQITSNDLVQEVTPPFVRSLSKGILKVSLGLSHFLDFAFFESLSDPPGVSSYWN